MCGAAGGVDCSRQQGDDACDFVPAKWSSLPHDSRPIRAARLDLSLPVWPLLVKCRMLRSACHVCFDVFYFYSKVYLDGVQVWLSLK
jgi:hypothetical protein